MSDKVVISDLPIGAHQVYAEGQEYNRAFIDEAGPVAKHTEVGVFLPNISLEDWLESYFGTNLKKSRWSLFAAPKRNAANPNSLFSFQLVPSLGSPDALEAHIEEVKSGKKKKKTIRNKKEEKDKEKLIHFLESLIIMDKLLSKVNAERSRYHKG